jgi:hypothetical protein
MLMAIAGFVSPSAGATMMFELRCVIAEKRAKKRVS